jgi:plasmid maintenance system antidote protein VapI
MMNKDDIQKAIDQSLEKLKTWIASEYGRMTKLAAELEVPKQRVSDWIKGKRKPTLEAWLKIQEFLKKQSRKKS